MGKHRADFRLGTTGCYILNFSQARGFSCCVSATFSRKLRSFVTFIMIKNALKHNARSLQVCSANIGKRYAHAPAVFNWEDPLGSANLFTEEELAIQETAKSYCQERMLPRVLSV